VLQGDARVMVEERRVGESFGKGRKVTQTFAQVVAQARQGDDTHYLTTQEVLSRLSHSLARVVQ